MVEKVGKAAQQRLGLVELEMDEDGGKKASEKEVWCVRGSVGLKGLCPLPRQTF